MFKEVVSNWFKATKIGDYMEGTLVGSQERTGVDPQGRPQTQQVYEVLVDEGKFHNLIKNASGQKVIDEANPIVMSKGDYYQFAKGSINQAMRKIKIGQKVKFVFDSVMPSKDKMKNDSKLVKVYAGDLDEAWMKEQWGEVPVAENDEPAAPATPDGLPPFN